MNSMRLTIALTFLLVYFPFTGAEAFDGDTTTPALIPMPQSVTWTNDQFDLSTSHEILIADESLREEAM